MREHNNYFIELEIEVVTWTPFGLFMPLLNQRQKGAGAIGIDDEIRSVCLTQWGINDQYLEPRASVKISKTNSTS